MEHETYLGDGLYASFDGWYWILRAPRENGDHWVGLEPAVLHEFLKFVERSKAEMDARNKSEPRSNRGER